MNETNGTRAGEQCDRAPVAKSPADTAELFEIAGSEGDAIRQLSGCVAQLTRVQAAKDALKSLSPAEVREALVHRHRMAGPSLKKST